VGDARGGRILTGAGPGGQGGSSRLDAWTLPRVAGRNDTRGWMGAGAGAELYGQHGVGSWTRCDWIGGGLRILGRCTLPVLVARNGGTSFSRGGGLVGGVVLASASVCTRIIRLLAIFSPRPGIGESSRRQGVGSLVVESSIDLPVSHCRVCERRRSELVGQTFSTVGDPLTA
jgi:hypothetical protein